MTRNQIGHSHWKIAVLLLGLAAPALANDASSFALSGVPSLVYVGQNQKMIFTIHPDGKVEIGEGVTTDEAAKAFWDAVIKFGMAAACANVARDR